MGHCQPGPGPNASDRPLFPIAQIELPGRLGPDDGRYLEERGGTERILVLETVGMLPPARRNRRKPKPDRGRDGRARVPLTIVTAVFADRELGDVGEAEEWLAGLGGEGCDRLLEEAFDSLDRLLATQAAATGRPYVRHWGDEDALAARVGYADGDGAYAGELDGALSIDVRGGAAAPRRERLSRSAPLRRVAAVLRGRESLRASEVLVPRVRADLDAGRVLEAAAVTEVAVALTVRELGGLAEDEEHRADIAAMEAMLPDLATMTEGVVDTDTAWPGLGQEVEDALGVAERTIRRIRVLDP